MSTYDEIMKYYGKLDKNGDPLVPPATFNDPPSEFPETGMKVAWQLPDWPYSRERFEEQWKKYQMCLEFEKQSDFQWQSNLFLSDYPELQKKNSDKVPEKKEEKKEEEVIQLTRPIDHEDLMYVMDHYDYDPEDDVVNSYTDNQAENFIRGKVVEFRKSIGKQI